MTIHNRRLKYILFELGDSPDEASFECQVKNWQVVNNTEDGDKLFSYCFDPNDPNAGETREETEPDFVLHLEMYSDWRSGGFSTWAWQHNGETVGWRIDHHPDIAAEHVQWAGRVKIKAPTAGGQARTTEMSVVDWPIIGEPDFLDPSLVS